MRYLADANIFLATRKRDFPVRIFPRMWDHVRDQCDQGVITSIDRVRNEVAKFEDEQAEFFSACLPKSTLLVADDFAVAYGEVQTWAVGQGDRYKGQAVKEFAQYEVADAWLVAVARERKLTVLTAEVREPLNRKRVKVPDACDGMGVDSCSFLDFLEATGYRG